MNRTAKVFTALVLLLGLSSSLPAADWTTYQGDIARSGSTAENLKTPLSLKWVHSAPSHPKRAWSGPEGRVVEGKELRDRVKFDDAFQVAVAGGKVYFGSSVDHQVHCLNAISGKEQWSFYTGAPIRLAPTVVAGKVYVGSDDGYAYCLNANDGSLVWKLRLGPADEWMIARGEMISRWPVRTGILIDDGIAYFGAGIFPHENVYLCAAEASSGKIIWRNDKISHKDAGRNDLSPQGYLLATENLLYVPSGRTRPKMLDRKTGKLTGGPTTSLKLTDTIIAGTDAVIADGRLNAYSLGTRLAVSGDASFVATGTSLMRLDRKAFAVANGKRGKLNSQIGRLSRSLRSAGDKAAEIRKEIEALKVQRDALENDGVVWKSASEAEDALIITGNLAITGEDEKVAAFDVETGKQLWHATVEGAARGLAVSDGRLIVSTTTGDIYCFADPNLKNVGDGLVNPGAINPFPKDELTETFAAAAEAILKESKATSGFCLVLGNEQGRLAYELARRSNLKIYAVDSDPKKVELARKNLNAAGLYGHRVTVHHQDYSTIPYSNYFANLIVSETAIRTGKIPGSGGQLARHLKPAGGVICLGSPGNDSAVSAAKAWLEKTKLADHSTTKTSGPWTLLTRGTLPGAGNWSHQYGDPGNTASSGDKLVKGGLGVLWYGDPGPDQMVNRHQGAVGPLVVNGRMFIQGTDSLLAYDTYNGQFLWEHANPTAVRTGVFQNRTPGNLAASGDNVFHMLQEVVIQHDAATGKIIAQHKLPASIDAKTHAWGYVAYHDGLLFGTATIREVIERARRRRGNPGNTATDSIFAIDVKTGKHLWVYQGKSIDFQTIALGPDKVFFIDSSVTGEQRAAILREDKTELKLLKGEEAKRAEERMKKLDVRLAVAINAKTGEKLWAKPVDVTDCSEIGIGGGKLTLMYQDGVLIFCGANANGHYWRQFVSGEFSRRRMVALSADDGYKLWSKDANYRHRPIIIGKRVVAEPWAFDLVSGEQEMRVHPLTGKKVPWSIMRPGHHCGMLTGCENMIMFRSGFTAFYDLNSDSGTRHFAGHRLGCWINAIPTNGLVVIPEASAGCVCMFSIASTIVMEPREPRRAWTLYSGVGTTTPVQQMSLNFGAPGDRRDGSGNLWLAYPRPKPNTRLETSLDLDFKAETKFLTGGAFFSNDGDGSVQSAKDEDWIVSSGGLGLNSFSIPLLGAGDKATTYSVRLHFSNDAADTVGSRVFDVRVQGKTVLKNVDSKSGSLIRELNDISVSDNLLIELVPKSKKPTSGQLPILSGIEIRRSSEVAVNDSGKK